MYEWTHFCNVSYRMCLCNVLYRMCFGYISYRICFQYVYYGNITETMVIGHVFETSISRSCKPASASQPASLIFYRIRYRNVLHAGHTALATCTPSSYCYYTVHLVFTTRFYWGVQHNNILGRITGKKWLSPVVDY